MQTLEVSLPAEASNTKTKRLTVIDMVRGITILLVVMGHADFTPVVLGDLFRDFRMPLFFMVSGYIFSASKYSHNLRLLIRTRLFSLVVPYFSAGILAYLIWVVLQTIAKGQSWDIVWYKPLLAIVYGTSLEGNLINVPIWFLTCLFVTQIIFCMVMRYVDSFSWQLQLGIMLLLSLSGFFMSTILFLPWNIDVALVAQLFVFVGYKLKQYKLIEKLHTFDLSSIVLFLLFLLTAYFNSYVDMNNRIYGNVLLFYVAGITGSILVIKMTNALTPFKWFARLLTYLGQESLPILIFHYGIFILVLNFLEQTVFHLYLNWLITTIIAVSGSLLFNLLVRKIPILHFLLNGKRTPVRPQPLALWSRV
ncbi:acyltransferase family protein [Paenibacillus sp. 19GGS1-52]|uniref:acyltransferase family protein n=1 Tax=Paenibacillus sp. 19GGS1-52 TaxID=2758563 RepID=UPI001EFC0863|nr:acyltransferase family protein [Paenibacillus sp. 19GGS1-52]ULO08647.1 acyltransferase family protein [Paenibacillus sp. 19GGS1-52]